MPRTICNGVSCYWEEQGSGPAVLLAHALFCDAEVWEPVARDLSRDHRVIRIDLRCHGRSVGSTHTWPVSELAGDLAALLDGAGLQRAVVVGSGLGGQGALRLAIQHPEKVAGLVLMGVDPAAEQPLGRAVWKVVHMLATRFEPDQRPALVPRAALLNPVLEKIMFSTATRPVRKDLVDRWLETFGAQDPTSTPFAITAMAERDDVRGSLGQVRAPTLVLDGADDRFTPTRRSARLAKSIPGARHEVIEKAGHMLPIEKPDEVIRALRGFLTGVSQAAA